MPTTLKVLRRENTGVVYADTSKPDLTVRFRGNSQGKTLAGVATTNFVQEIIFNDVNPVQVNGQDATDAVSVRLRTSGAKQSKARVKQILLSMAAQVDNWEAEGVFEGFDPETAPVILDPA